MDEVTSDETQLEKRALAAMRALVGKPIGAPSVAPDPVNLPMIRHWATALEDQNPVSTNPEFAAGSRFGAIVAPPLMLQTWTMATPKISGIAVRGGSPVESGDNPLTPLDEAGFIATLATNSEFEIVRYLRLGEVITSTMVIESVSDKKQTRIGPGHFITWVATFRVAQGRVHRALRQRRLPSPVPAPEHPMTRTTLDWNEIRVGDALTPMTIDVTATVVVAGAIASRDFMPVHHDRDYANAQGSPNIFLNIMGDNGFCSRYLRGYSG